MSKATLARAIAVVRLADRLLNQDDITSPPISTDILKRFHPEIEIVPAALGRVASALRLRSDPAPGQSGASITFNKGQSIPRQRFSIAHEYGHYLLHHLCVLDSGGGLPELSNRAMEAEADLFASSLLVPLWMLDGLCPDFDYRDEKEHSRDRLAYKLASQFNVSRACMNKALFQLYHLRKVYGRA